MNFDQVREAIEQHGMNCVDYKTRSPSITVLPTGQVCLAEELFAQANVETIYDPTDYARTSLLTRLGLEKRAFDKMLTYPKGHDCAGTFDLPLQSVVMNYLLRLHHPDKGWMVRTRRDTVRAFLTDRFTPFDHRPYLDALLHPETGINKAAQVHQFSLGTLAEDMYLKLKFPELRVQRDGEEYHVGVICYNGELGNRAAGIEPFIHRKACLNDMVVVSEWAWKQRHIGGGFSNRLLTAIFADRILHACREALDTVDKLEELRQVEIPDLNKEIAKLKAEYHLGDNQTAQVQAFTLEEAFGQVPTAFAYVNAVTRLARLQESVDVRFDLETAAGKELVRLHRRV